MKIFLLLSSFSVVLAMMYWMHIHHQTSTMTKTPSPQQEFETLLSLMQTGSPIPGVQPVAFNPDTLSGSSAPGTSQYAGTGLGSTGLFFGGNAPLGG